MMANRLKSCMLCLYNIRLLYICTTHLQFLYLSVDVHQADGTKRNDLHGSAQWSEMRSNCLIFGSCDRMGIPSVIRRLWVLASCCLNKEHYKCCRFILVFCYYRRTVESGVCSLCLYSQTFYPFLGSSFPRYWKVPSRSHVWVMCLKVEIRVFSEVDLPNVGEFW